MERYSGYYDYGYRNRSSGVADCEVILYIAIIIVAIISIIASIRVKSVFNKYNQIPSMSGFTGATAAQRILQYAGVTGVRITVTEGTLTDHYDPRDKTLYLSKPVFYGNSVAAIGVAAHESGHAMQHAEGYAPLRIRSALVPAASIGSRFGIWVAIIGFYIAQRMAGNALWLMDIGIIMFGAAVIFQLVTLPVEFDASKRALKKIVEYGFVSSDEHKGAKKMLTSAALTYVAGVLSTIMEVLRLFLIVSGRDDR
jgi:Zn-dependent membrane protease YugP